MPNQGALANIDLDHILERVANGEYQKTIAAELGVSPPALHYKLKAVEKQHSAARECGMEVRLDAAEIEIERASDALNLARASQKFKAVSWRAEREFPHRWSAQQKVTHELGETFDDLLASISEKRKAGAVQQREIIDVTPDKYA